MTPEILAMGDGERFDAVSPKYCSASESTILAPVLWVRLSHHSSNIVP
ncbi:MAG: hypothetical protein VKJ64_03685 [Leptolyngbyaceae bacterium]|nr:hypothetical protein [Leptolyngbyaceae bacterium]